MHNFQIIAHGIDVSETVRQIEAHPELWNQHPGRTREDSPHYGVPDIWVRFRAPEELTSAEAFREPHEPIFYPAWFKLWELHAIVMRIRARVSHIKKLGGILITKIPPGGQVKPHNDRGGWHAEYYNTKVYVALQTNDKCVNHCEDESITLKTGDAMIFDNLREHSVENNGDTDRITLIICLRTEE